MCYNYSQELKAQDLEIEYNREMPSEYREQYQPYYNADGYAHPLMPVISSDQPNIIQLQEWGLIPIWAKSDDDAKVKRKGTLNAKAETLFELNSFKNIAPTRRCLILVSGIFEPHHFSDGDVRYYYITRKSKRSFAIGGIWNYWRSPQTGIVHRSFSMITTPPNPLLEAIHNNKPRMPFFVPDHQHNSWLSNDISITDIQSLMQPYEDVSDLRAWPISKSINYRKTNSNIPETLQRAELSHPVHIRENQHILDILNRYIA
ncbi:hypothetical protein N180_20610 [Pedobacter antarcticus 4BY]|uniref:Abasic site processing protein n=2 Tax=Pedobacter antarcticus TaxID=34086 RepID=A0A081PGL6_9SPHI|nr:SOS response-associated peptidase [Pedobacter antarcticus]KEQ29839.1 hypothetical protein N180_20610 [Pedobacter antarcticus 4BY]SFF44337.1 Putative SOS response-associated peptidase YedK [Pedobacter antarcticus]